MVMALIRHKPDREGHRIKIGWFGPMAAGTKIRGNGEAQFVASGLKISQINSCGNNWSPESVFGAVPPDPEICSHHLSYCFQ